MKKHALRLGHRLSLTLKTIRTLSSEELGGVAGGAQDGSKKTQCSQERGGCVNTQD